MVRLGLEEEAGITGGGKYKFSGGTGSSGSRCCSGGNGDGTEEAGEESLEFVMFFKTVG